MLKIVLSLIGDWLAYRRAISGGSTPQRLQAGLGAVSIWPLERDVAPGRGCVEQVHA